MSTSHTTRGRQQRILLAMFFATLLLAGSARTVSAYDDDTHFWLTYYLARKAGYTHIQSTQIASGTVSVDYDKNTKPALPIPDSISDWFHFIRNMQTIHASFHAMPWKSEVIAATGGGPMVRWDPTEIPASWRPVTTSIVNRRRDQLWQVTWNTCSNPGVFLHYLQDSFAHEGFLGRIGHQGYERVDFIATDVPKARLMAEATLRYLTAYRSRSTPLNCVAGAAPNPSNIVIDPVMKADVYRVIDLFAAANPSSGRPETNLLIAWRGLTEEQKLARPLVDLPPNDMKLALLGRLECALAPDSYLARNIIVNEFGLNWSNVPRIWLYDLDSAGGINYVVTREYLEYALQHPIRTIESFNGRTEAQNKSVVCPRPAQYEDVDCLAYMLSNDSVTALPKCRLRRDDADEPIGKCQHRKD